MFAVIKTGGKQYRVVAEDILEVAKVDGKPGDVVEFGEVLVVGGDTPTLGTPTVAGATVAGEVLEQGRGPKVIAFKKRRRKNSRRKRGHRQEFTLVRITEILTDGKKPAQTPPPRPKKPVAQAKKAPEDEAAAETKGEAKKGEAKKGKTKKGETKKGEAKKAETKTSAKPRARAKQK